MLKYACVMMFFLGTVLSGTCQEESAAISNGFLDGSFQIRDELNNVHPRLYTTPNAWQETRARFQAEPDLFAQYLPDGKRMELRGPLQPFDREVTGQKNSIAFAKVAVAYCLTDDARYLERLMEWLPLIESYDPPAMHSVGGSVGLTAGHILLGFSISYDMLVGHAPAELTDAIRALLIRQADQLQSDLLTMSTLPFEQNHLIIPVCGLAVCAMTMADTVPQAEQWGMLSSNILNKSLQAIAYDGWFFEGFSYWNYTMQFPAAYASARQRVLGDDLLKLPPFDNAVRYLAHMTLPDSDFVFDFADWGPRTESDGVGFQKGYDWPWHTYPSQVKRFIPLLLEKTESDPSFLYAYLNRATSKESASHGEHLIDGVFGMLLEMPPVDHMPAGRAKDPDYPPYHYFPDMEVVHWRADWNDTNAVAIAFKSGPPAGHHFNDLLDEHGGWKHSLGHAHPDAGSFILFGYGKFLANDTGYTGAKETANHNSILVDGFGQHEGGTAWRTFQGKPYSEYNKIHQKHVWLAPSVAASTAVFDAAYEDAQNLTQAERKLVMIGGRFLVIQDQLASTDPHEYEWRLHSDQPAQAVGPNRYVMQNETAQLVIADLGKSAEFSVDPTIVETSTTRKFVRPQQRGYHLSLTSEKIPEHRFLTAMCIQSSREDSSVFQAEISAPGVVLLQDGDVRCRVWFENAAELNGAYAYALEDADGELKEIGMYGRGLHTASFSIESERNRGVVFQRTESGAWQPDGCGKQTATLRFEVPENNQRSSIQ